MFAQKTASICSKWLPSKKGRITLQIYLHLYINLHISVNELLTLFENIVYILQKLAALNDIIL